MFKFSEDSVYRTPAHFGNLGQKGLKSEVYHDVTTIAISYETDGNILAQYVPEAFQLTQPIVSIYYVMSRGVDWMAGGHYNLIGVDAPVVYTHGEERLEGTHCLVMWENKTCPILMGREFTGIPKIFADIEDHHQLDDRLFTNASYEGVTFLRMDFQKTRKMTAQEVSMRNQQGGKLNWFGWRYIPNIGRPGAALSHATLYPQEMACTEGWTGSGEVHWQALTPEQHPTQFHIIRALSQLPIKAYRDCIMIRGSQTLRNDIARQLP